jgi:AraC family transcriptional regulator
MLDQALPISDTIDRLPPARVAARMELAVAAVELCEYDIDRPRRCTIDRTDDILEMTLSDRPALPRARYLEIPAMAARPLGEIMFIPAGHAVDLEWEAGRRRVIRCIFRNGDQRPPRSWTKEELLAGLDIRSQPVRAAMLGLAEEMTAPGFQSSLLAQSLSGLAAVELGRYFRKPPAFPIGPGRLTPMQMQQIDARILTGGRLPTAGELAAQCGFSKRHFFRVFRRTTGQSLVDYATARRIDRAKALLRENGLVVKQIAHQCGFGTPAAFSAAFRRATGMTPRQYRSETAG